MNDTATLYARIPREVYDAVRALARRERRTLAAQTFILLEEALGIRGRLDGERSRLTAELTEANEQYDRLADSHDALVIEVIQLRNAFWAGVGMTIPNNPASAQCLGVWNTLPVELREQLSAMTGPIPMSEAGA